MKDPIHEYNRKILEEIFPTPTSNEKTPEAALEIPADFFENPDRYKPNSYKDMIHDLSHADSFHAGYHPWRRA